MKSTVIAASFGAAVASVPHPDRLAQIKLIQETPDVLWKPAVTSRFGSEAPGASKILCGLKGNWSQDIEEGVAKGEIVHFSAEGLTETDIPDSFDSETNWPDCAKVIGDIRDQSNCGCCWAFAAAEAASDRMCIASAGKLAFPLSAQDVCFCASSNGCGGGDITSPWHYIMNKGAVSGGQFNNTGPFQGMCADFSMPHCHHHGPQKDDPFPAEGKPGCASQTSASCPTGCDANAAAGHNDFAGDKYSFKNGKPFGLGSIATASGEEGIQKMIMSGGPVETAFTVYEDFENYDGGIYHHVTGGQAGGHAVKMVGWGVEGGVKYWKVANSWNPYWAEKGYFRIKRGNNEGGIESGVVGSDVSSKWSKKSEQHAEAVVV